jgi:hypothetical protein
MQVDDTCYNLDSKANHTIERVQKLDTRLQDVHVGVQAANQVGTALDSNLQCCS